MDGLVTRIDLAWFGNRPDAVLGLIHGGAVRAAMLIESQVPGDRERVHAAIVVTVRLRHTPEGKYVVRRPVLLAKGWKPVV